MQRQKMDSPCLQICVSACPEWSSQEQSRIILCEYIYLKRILYFFLSTDGKASISACIHDFVGFIKEKENPPWKKPFRSE